MTSLSPSLDVREAVRDRLARLAHFGDLDRADDAAACYTDDGVFRVTGFPPEIAEDSSTVGRTALTEMYQGLFGANQGHVRHWTGNTYIDQDAEGDVVARSSFFLVRVGLAPTPGIVLTGLYADRFTEVGGAWLIRSRDCLVDPQAAHRDAHPTDVLLARLDAAHAAR